ncbi:LysR family transcriptional regulator [Mesorhizobium sp. SP-1A]|uniref:LysR family transcriptional regulator n=1 Tax=Mesorhizobium sp. SP-1A TaxID=3077840 RepID=UPI0028F6F5B6|nr:LysR family transcriptional regulator [Mesorhizobium sp. SP-1A]
MDSLNGLPPLDWLRSFEAAARLSNFTAAASELGLTQAAVSQHIRLLEERLKRRLFTRLARGVELTPDGAAYLPHLQSAFATIGASTRELFETRPVETVTLRSPISFAVLMIAPLLPTLAAAVPSAHLRIETIHTPADQSENFAGPDIRYGNGSFPGRRADLLTRETLVPMAAPGLADGSDWTRLPMLSVVGAREMWGEWFAAARLPPGAGASLKFDSFVVALEAAKNGAGVLLGSRPLANAALREGSLVPLSDFVLASGAGHHLTSPATGPLSGATESVRRWLVAAFQSEHRAGPQDLR